MSYKARVLVYSGQKKVKAAAELIKKAFELENNKMDDIPPAYPCDKERIVFLCLSVKKDLPDGLRRFIAEMDKSKAQTVALLIEGADAADSLVRNTLAQPDEKKNATVFEKTFFLKGSFMAFAGSLSAEEKSSLEAWVASVKASL